MPINSLLYPANSAVAGGYDVDNSVRMSGATVNLQRDFSGNGNRRTWTYSTWFKLSKITQSGFFNWGKGNPEFSLRFESATSNTANNYFRVSQYDNSQIFDLVTTQFFADPSAWGHMVVAFDTTQGTASNRIKIYFNGTQITSLSTESYPSQNFDTFVNQASKKHYIGYADYQPINGYLSETVFIDGQQLAPTDFGEFDEDSGIWKPIKISGLTFGTNGYYLQYKEAGTSQNSSGIGADTSGNNNHFACDDVVAIDQSTDTCTNNFATVNSLDSFYEASTFSEGNLKIVTESGDYSYNTSTIGLSSGKWYCEVFVESSPTGNASIIGIAGRMSEASLGFLGGYLDTYGFYGANGNMYNIGGNGVTSYGSGYAVNSVIGIYMDLDNNKLYFAINGTIQNSGTGYTILAPNLTKAGFYFPAAADNYNGSSGTFRLNFGNPIYALSSANTDANGFGSFEYDPSAGTFDGASKDFLAICTKNLAEFG